MLKERLQYSFRLPRFTSKTICRIWKHPDVSHLWLSACQELSGWEQESIWKTCPPSIMLLNFKATRLVFVCQAKDLWWLGLEGHCNTGQQFYPPTSSMQYGRVSKGADFKLFGSFTMTVFHESGAETLKPVAMLFTRPHYSHTLV